MTKTLVTSGVVVVILDILKCIKTALKSNSKTDRFKGYSRCQKRRNGLRNLFQAPTNLRGISLTISHWAFLIAFRRLKS